MGVPTEPAAPRMRMFLRGVVMFVEGRMVKDEEYLELSLRGSEGSATRYGHGLEGDVQFFYRSFHLQLTDVKC
jgi:hypothetical protein